MLWSKKILAGGFMTLLLLTGCGQTPETNPTTTNTSAPAPPAVPETTFAGPVWVAELRQGEAALGQTVEQGRMAEVHDQAVALQALLKNAAQEAGTLGPEMKQQLDDHLAAADRLVGELHDAGDAGDLGKARAKFQEFQTHLRAIEGLFGVSAP